MSRLRLDEWLVDKGYYATRARARDAIKRGCVSLGGERSVKPARTVTADLTVTVNDPASRYVSRAALKLVHALDTTGLSPKGRLAVDIGASTGGFCQVLLEAGAEHVWGIDVGHDQLDESLQRDERLTPIEGLNARDLKLEHLGGNRPQFITCDVSFISLKLALPQALELAADEAIGIFLVKPQFEVGKEALGKGGIVREEGLAENAARGVRDWLDARKDWRVTHLLPSPVSGGDGNLEYLMAAEKHG